MKNSLLPLGAAVVIAAGCGLPQDEGVVMGCFGLVNWTIPGEDVVTNMFFGGCSPDDVGMQIMERATETASQDQDALAQRCNQDCGTRLTAYKNAHPEVDLPLSCQTLFVSPCEDLRADVSGSPLGGMAFQAGGPADTRYTMTGSVTISINGVSQPAVPATGIVDGTMPCASNQSCAFTLSRLDVVAATAGMAFPFNGMEFEKAQFQNQGVITGSKQSGSMTIGPDAIKGQVSAKTTSGAITSFTVTNPAAVTKNVGNLTLDQFLSPLNLTMNNGLPPPNNVVVQISMTGTPTGNRPVAAITALQTTYECQCKECTTAEFSSAATDVDNDLNNLAWKLDGVPQLADGTGAPQTLALQVGVGPHTVSLVATDTRGAAAAASRQFTVVDTVPPEVWPPANVTLRQCDFPDIGRAIVATDLCSPDKLVISSNASGNYNVGTNTITWTAEDASGNQGTATQTVTITNAADSACCPPGYPPPIFAVDNGQPTNGTNGNDCIIGTSNNNVINGNGGNDYIIGGGGQDTINGGDGDDVILGGFGNDTIIGGNGNDRIAGGPDQDTINGNAGADIIIAGDGDDRVEGDDGADTIYGNNGQDRLAGGPASDFIDGGFGDDQINSGNSASTGNLGDDELNGGFGNDTINDTSGNNRLYGFLGDDKLTGGTGNDTLLGGGGHNTCVGGGGGGTDIISCL
jgi:hypothetical protein